MSEPGQPRTSSGPSKLLIGCLTGAGVVAFLVIGSCLYIGRRLKSWSEAQEKHIRNISLEAGTPAGEAIAAARRNVYDPASATPLTEERLQLYLDIRKRVGEAWLRDGGILAVPEDEWGQGAGLDAITELMALFENWSAVVTGYAVALRDGGIHPDEFRDITVAVYDLQVPGADPDSNDSAATPAMAVPEDLLERHRETVEECRFGEMNRWLFLKNIESFTAEEDRSE